MTTSTSYQPRPNVNSWEEDEEDATNKPVSKLENSFALPRRLFPLRRNESSDDSTNVDVGKNLLARKKTLRDGWRSPCTVAVHRFWEDSHHKLLPQRRSRAALHQQEQHPLPLSFHVFYQSTRWALLFSGEGPKKMQPQEQPFEVCHCTLLLLQRVHATQRKGVLGEEKRAGEETSISHPLQRFSGSLKSSGSQDDVFQNGNLPGQQQQQQRRILIVAETDMEDASDEGTHIGKSSSLGWAREWAQTVMGQEFSAVYMLQQKQELQGRGLSSSPTNHEKDNELFGRKHQLGVQETWSQAMILKQVHQDNGDCSSCSSGAGEHNNDSVLISGPTRNRSDNNNDELTMILSRPFQDELFLFDELEEDTNVVMKEPVQMPHESNNRNSKGSDNDGHMMTMLTEEGALSNLSRASSVILHLCCSDHVAMNDAARKETLSRLYQQLAQHAVLLCESTTKDNTAKEINDFENTLDGLGKISWILLQTGQSMSIHDDQRLPGYTLSLIGAIQEIGEDQIAAIASTTLQEYFAARFLTKNIVTEDREQSFEFCLRQDSATRFVQVLVYVAGGVCRKHGLDGMRSLLAFCRRNGARDVLGVYQLCLELRLVHEWLTITGTENAVKEDGLSELEAEFNILEECQRWFKTGIIHMQRGRGQEPSACLLSFLTEGLKASAAILRYLPGYADSLLQACEDENEAVRKVASDTLVELIRYGQAFDAGHATLLLDLCAKHECESVRHAATRAIAEVVEATPELASQCFSTILNACKDDSLYVRTAAAEALAKIAIANPPSCLSKITLVCRSDRNEHVRAAAAFVLGKVLEATPNLAEECLPTLLDTCNADRAWTVREAATAALTDVARTNSELTEKCLSAFSDVCKNDRSEKVRQAAALAMAELANAATRFASRCFRSLLDTGKDENKCVRRATICALVNVAKVNPILAKRFHSYLSDICKEDRSEAVRQAAALALGEVAKVNQVIACKCRLTLNYVAREDRAASVRKAAVYALGQVAFVSGEASRCLPALVDSCLEDPHPTVRQAAAQVLEMHGELSKQVLTAILKHCRENNRKVQGAAAAHALAEIGETNPSMVDCRSFHSDASHDDEADQSGITHAPVVMRDLHPYVATQCVSRLLEAYQEASCDEIRKAASYFLTEVAQSKDAQQCLPFLLQAAFGRVSSAENLLREPVSCVLRSLSIEQLISGYWATQDDALLPFIAEDYFRTPFFTCSNDDGDRPILVLYNTAGQRVEWEDGPNQLVQTFGDKIAGYFFQDEARCVRQS